VTGQPAQSSCIVSPGTFTLNGSTSQAVTLTVTTVAAAAGLIVPCFGLHSGNAYVLRIGYLAMLGVLCALQFAATAGRAASPLGLRPGVRLRSGYRNDHVRVRRPIEWMRWSWMYRAWHLLPYGDRPFHIRLYDFDSHDATYFGRSVIKVTVCAIVG